MFVFGHLGIGNKLASPWTRGARKFPKIPLFLGMLLPDLIDKPLYYAHLWSYVSCTRTFAHSGVFLALILILSWLISLSPRGLASSRWLVAIALGVSTHLLLDCLIDRFAPSWPTIPSSAFVALTWPYLNAHFAEYRFANFGEHLHHLLNAPVLISEAVGLSLIGWDYWKSSHRGAILEVLFSRRWRMLKRRRLERD